MEYVILENFYTGEPSEDGVSDKMFLKGEIYKGKADFADLLKAGLIKEIPSKKPVKEEEKNEKPAKEEKKK
jgi:hypothetical protein